MNKKSVKHVIIAAALSVAAVFSAALSGCGSGKDGANGKDLNIYDLYEAAKTVEGNENLTLDEFLKEYLNYTSAELEEAVSLQKAINRSLLSSVAIRCQYAVSGATVPQVTYGSGFIIDVNRESGDMLVATNCHVIYSADAKKEGDSAILDGYATDVSLWLYGSEYVENRKITANLVAASKQYDLALLRVRGSDVVRSSHVAAVSWGNDEECYIGETVYAVGNAGGNKISASTGYVSKDMDNISINFGSTVSELHTYKAIRLAADISHGNSGGGLFNSGGELIGMVNARSTVSDTTYGYALPTSEVKRVVSRILADDEGRFVKGVRLFNHGIMVDVTDSYSQGLNDKGFATICEEVTVSGIDMGSVFVGSLHTGDVLKKLTVTRQTEGGEITVEDIDVLREHNFYDALISVRAGDRINLTVKRGGSTVVANVVVPESAVSLLS